MPQGVGYSDDFAGDIAELMQQGMIGDTRAQETIMQLMQMAEGGDERVARFIDDAASRIKEQRHFPEEGIKDSNYNSQRISELLGTKDETQPTEREQQLLMIIARLQGQLNEAGAVDGGQGQDAQLRAREASTQDTSLPQG